MLRKIVNRVRKKFKKRKTNWKRSYSQCGEDLIIKFIFDIIGIKNPSYIDIGAHHPTYLNNTALLHMTGSIGINIEPDPILFKEFIRSRRKDINLNIGISDKEDEIDFYIINDPTLNTFSEQEANNYKKEGDYFVKSIKKVKVQTVASILEKYADNKFPDLLTIDAEGIDELVLKSIDFETNFPIVICTETISFSNTGNGIKNVELIEFIKSNGYILYADTYINSIFVRKDRWVNRSN
jgi:FkbM family methyltransferase